MERVTTMTCVKCDEKFSYPVRPGGPRRHCDGCRRPPDQLSPETRARRAAQSRAYYATKVRGSDQYVRHRAVKDQNKAARKAVGLETHWRQVYPEMARASDQRRRAIKGGASNATRVLAQQIYERDSWICGICDDPVDPTLAYPDPMSVSLDHVVPLTAGGDHVESNLQCSHLRCNISKGGARVS